MNLRRPPANADSTSGSAIYAVRASYNYSLCLDASTLTGGKLVLSVQTPIGVYCGCPHSSGLSPLSWSISSMSSRAGSSGLSSAPFLMMELPPSCLVLCLLLQVYDNFQAYPEYILWLTPQ